MAQVLAPIVQTSGSITMLHSSSDAFQNQSTTQPHHQQQRSSQMQRSQGYNGQNGNTGYRSTSAAPIAPYAFSSTPQLRQENRASSAPGNPYTQQQNAQMQQPARLGHPSHPSSSSDSTVSTSGSSSRSVAGQPFSKDDTAINTDQRKSTAGSLPASTITLSTSVPDLTLASLDAPVKPSPGRYRRGAQRTDSSNSVTPASTPTPTQQSHQAAPLSLSSQSADFRLSVPTFSDLDILNKPSHTRANSADDLHVPRPGAIDQAKRYRRRSLGNVGAEATALAAQAPAPAIAPLTPIVPAQSSRPTQEFRPMSSSGRPSSRSGSRPGSSHERQGSSGSTSSNTSARPSSSRQETGSRSNGSKQQTNLSSRGPAESSKRVTAPSPLSKPLSPSEPSSPTKRSPLAPNNASSPAMQQLSALNEKESGKGMKSRLRRAFSFGSAAELRRASAENNLSAERAKLRKDKYQDERDAETEAIIAKQEAAGIGAGIYSGQGGFSGSTDNLSISSTASSASIMLRKMGSGMKKGGRSIKGLFRPKSVIGVPAADGPVTQPSAAQVSMVTVEAEREKVNVNVNPHDQVGGGTGYPRLERNSLDAGRTADVNGIVGGPIVDSRSRKTIVGGDRERAEILSSMKKGILKRTGTNSETPSPIAKPGDVPYQADTPKSSAPSTPNDDHSRPIQVHVNGEDYFGGTPRIPNASTRSLPNTPHGSRNISFSPRIQFHDAWSASDYDRRGDIATCNRLTPMLAQQIKEELNSFKMEMEVHELSKPHTHFF